MANDDDFEAMRAILAECVWHDYLHDYRPAEIGLWRNKAMELLERHGWKMSHLRELGTIAFDMDHMLRLIRFGTPQVDELGQVTWSDHPQYELNFGVWLATVPEVFQAIAMRGLERMFEARRGTKVNEDARREMIWEVHQYCYTRVRDAHAG